MWSTLLAGDRSVGWWVHPDGTGHALAALSIARLPRSLLDTLSVLATPVPSMYFATEPAAEGAASRCRRQSTQMPPWYSYPQPCSCPHPQSTDVGHMPDAAALLQIWRAAARIDWMHNIDCGVGRHNNIQGEQPRWVLEGSPELGLPVVHLGAAGAWAGSRCEHASYSFKACMTRKG